jgi:23S rRNA G2445 N2-methylase RlmL
MSYEYAIENINYEDYSSGRVLYNQQGATSFPVRLTCEIFQRCIAILEKSCSNGPYRIYDPLCGGAYALTTLGFLYGDRISSIYASDIDLTVIGLAEKNLSLLSKSGLEERTAQIERMYQEFGKESHKEALQSASKLHDRMNHWTKEIVTKCFISDAMKQDNSLLMEKMDIVITDIPYGEVVEWINMDSEEAAIRLLLDNLLPNLKQTSVVAVTTRKKANIKNENYKKVDRFKVGKREIVLLQPV